jgi:hypothetical protein
VVDVALTNMPPHSFVYLVQFGSVIDRAKKQKTRGLDHDLTIVIGDQIIPLGGDKRRVEAQVKAATAHAMNQMAAERDAWVDQQMELRRVVVEPAAGRDSSARPHVDDLSSQAQAWRHA